jgi:tRNA threonylcarbamoyladenosine biosynthesis protein TsaB
MNPDKYGHAVLAIECATDALSLALLADGVCRELLEHSSAKHTGRLLPLIRQLCDEQAFGLKSLSLIAVGIGPGSFTGVRTAVSAAQGLALALDLPLVGVDCLQALAWQSMVEGANGRVLAALDARMGEVYAAVYDCRAALPGPLTEPAAMSAAGLESLIALCPAVCIGNAAAAYPAWFGAAMAAGGIRMSDALPRAGAVAALGLLHARSGRAVSAEKIQPLYVRNRVALTIAERGAPVHAA